MCLIALAREAHPRFRLVVAANRDERHERPTAPAAWWDDAPRVLAGRDLAAGGTWLGVTRDGRFAAVTNVREAPFETRPDAPSRGALVAGFLRGEEAPLAFLHGVAGRMDDYAGFNLLVGDADGIGYLSNRGGDRRPRALEPGPYALSNASLDVSWPKTERSRAALRVALEGPDSELESALFALLGDRAAAPDDALPDTGLGRERERLLSAPFVAAPGYGTRASTILLVGRDGEARFVERTVDPATGRWAGELRFSFHVGEEAETG